jgi:predicted P-loop ATPase
VGLDKKPLVDRWKPFQERQATEEEFNAWEGRNPPAWALITGKLSGVIILDFDGQQGTETMRKLELEPHIQTGSGGYHVWVQHPGWHVPTLNAKTKVELNRQFPGMDIRGDGGYAVFEGRNESGEYKCLRALDDLYDCTEIDCGILPFIGKPVEESVEEKARQAPPVTDASGGRVDVERLVRNALDRAGTDGRNNAGFGLALQLRDNGYSQSEAIGIIRSYVGRAGSTNTKGQKEAYTMAEAGASVRKAYESPAREPWGRRVNGQDQQHRADCGSSTRHTDAPPAALPAVEKQTPNLLAGIHRDRGNAEPTATAAPWRDHLILNREGNPRAVLANAVTALRLSPEWGGAVAYNEFAAQITVQKALPWGEESGAIWSDQHDRKFAEWLQWQGILAPTKLAGEAVQTVAMERAYHPPRDYVRGLAWDAKARVDSWLTAYLGVQPNTYAAKIGRRWLVSAVARILQPGIKADAVLVLGGAQGIGKSTAGRTLFDPWFCDHLPDLSSKDSYLQLAGMWCIELAELDAIGRADASRIKSFLSSSVDRYRLPYGTRAIDVPRSSVFLGTVNHGAYLRDETGNRRFWPVRCGRIDLAALRRDRDQLWAEAVVLHANGASWWVDSADLARLAEEEQVARFEGEAWDSEIAEWARLRESVSVAEVLADCLKKDRAMWTQTDSNRVARSLRSMSWERYRERSANGLQWRYRRQES